MKTYFLDTNVILRFFLKDHPTQSAQARTYFEQAQSGEIKLVLIPEIVLEVEYVFRKVYKREKQEIIQDLTAIISSKFIDVKNREQLLTTLKLFQIKTIDLVGAFLSIYAQDDKAQVLSFDQDFKKLVKKKN